MTKKDTYGLLNTIKAAYPLFYSNTPKSAMDNVVNVWHEVIGRHDYGVAQRAISRMIQRETQIPTIAMVQTYIREELKWIAKEEHNKNARKLSGCESEEEYRQKIAELRR